VDCVVEEEFFSKNPSSAFEGIEILKCAGPEISAEGEEEYFFGEIV